MATYTFNDWNFGFIAEYEYITDPPILADWGNYTFNVRNLSYMLNGTTTFDQDESLL